jgi:hypothetical protein
MEEKSRGNEKCVRPRDHLQVGVVVVGRIARLYDAPSKRRRQQGHSPSTPRISDMNAVGWGSVMIALKARGAR